MRKVMNTEPCLMYICIWHTNSQCNHLLKKNFTDRTDSVSAPYTLLNPIKLII